MCICGESQAEHVDGGKGCPAFDDVQQFITGNFKPLVGNDSIKGAGSNA